MTAKFDSEKLQMIILYVNGVKMSARERGHFNQIVLKGILTGSIDFNEFCSIWPEQTMPTGLEAIRRFLNVFISERGNEVRIQAQDLYAAYVKWCEENDEFAETNTCFGMRLNHCGLKREKHSDGNYYRLDEKREAVNE